MGTRKAQNPPCILEGPIDTHIDISAILRLLEASQASDIPLTLSNALSKLKKPTTI